MKPPRSFWLTVVLDRGVFVWEERSHTQIENPQEQKEGEARQESQSGACKQSLTLDKARKSLGLVLAKVACGL